MNYLRRSSVPFSAMCRADDLNLDISALENNRQKKQKMRRVLIEIDRKNEIIERTERKWRTTRLPALDQQVAD